MLHALNSAFLLLIVSTVFENGEASPAQQRSVQLKGICASCMNNGDGQQCLVTSMIASSIYYSSVLLLVP